MSVLLSSPFAILIALVLVFAGTDITGRSGWYDLLWLPYEAILVVWLILMRGAALSKRVEV